MKKHVQTLGGLLIWVIWMWNCKSPEMEEHHKHQEHDAADLHMDEPAHAERPRRVQLSESVIAAASIQTFPVGYHPIARTIPLSGELVADPGRMARVSARISGIVEAIEVKPGEKVAEGDAIAVIRAPDLQSLRAQETVLKARAKAARANATRLRSLVEKRMASLQEAIVAEAEASALDAEARAAHERLRALDVQKSSQAPILFNVRSPQAGIVTKFPVVPGDPVKEDSIIATIVAMDELWFIAHVFEQDVPFIQENSRALVELNARPNELFTGTVTSISYQVDEGARTLSARIPVQNRDEKLRIGLFGTASVVVAGENSKPKLAVPRSAITEVFGEQVVFVHHPDGDFELHEVTLGYGDAEYVEILHGLREGEQVVREGVFNVKSALLRNQFGEDEH